MCACEKIIMQVRKGMGALSESTRINYIELGASGNLQALINYRKFVIDLGPALKISVHLDFANFVDS